MFWIHNLIVVKLQNRAQLIGNLNIHNLWHKSRLVTVHYACLVQGTLVQLRSEWRNTELYCADRLASVRIVQSNVKFVQYPFSCISVVMVIISTERDRVNLLEYIVVFRLYGKWIYHFCFPSMPIKWPCFFEAIFRLAYELLLHL
jgi:hypothetical protein